MLNSIQRQKPSADSGSPRAYRSRGSVGQSAIGNLFTISRRSRSAASPVTRSCSRSASAAATSRGTSGCFEVRIALRSVLGDLVRSDGGLAGLSSSESWSSGRSLVTCVSLIDVALARWVYAPRYDTQNRGEEPTEHPVARGRVPSPDADDASSRARPVRVATPACARYRGGHGGSLAGQVRRHLCPVRRGPAEGRARGLGSGHSNHPLHRVSGPAAGPSPFAARASGRGQGRRRPLGTRRVRASCREARGGDHRALGHGPGLQGRPGGVGGAPVDARLGDRRRRRGEARR